MNTHPLPTARYAGAFLIELDPTRDWSGVPGVVHGSDGSAWIDYARTPVAGGTENRIIGYEIADHADQPVRTLRATLQMSTTHDGVHWSLSSGAVNSPLNNLSGSFAPAIFGKRRIIVQDPLGSPASTNPADWRPRFWGHIDDHPSSSSGDLRIFARDAAARLMVPYTGEPVQIGPEGGAVSLHDAAQAVLDAAMGEGEWALLTEDDLNWAFPSFAWEGEEGSVLEALAAMAQQRGAVVRWWPDPVTGRFQLQMFVLQVDKGAPDHTFGPGETFDVPGHGSDTTSYRNDFTLRYVDASGDVQTIRRPATQAEKDAFGFEPLLIGEGSTSHIRTAGEANVMLDAVEAALRVPATVGSRLLPRTPGIEVNSKIRLLPDARVAQEISDLYVAGWTETVRNDERSVMVELRGAPVGRMAAYLESFARPTAPAPSFAIQYAEDEYGTGASPHFDPERHLYARTSEDGGRTWTDWFRFVGPPGTSFTIIGSLPDPSDLPPSGNVGDGYLIDGDLWVWDGAEWVNAGRVQGPPGPKGDQGDPGPQGQTGAPGADGAPAIMALLDNDSATIPTAEDGSGGVFSHATTTISVYEGNVDRSGLWSYSAAPSSGVTGSLSGRTYSVTAMSTDAGYVDITATRSGYPSLTVRFALAKAKGGAKGDPSTAYWLITDAAAVKRSRTGAYTPASLVVSGRSATGDGAPTPYAGRFQIATLAGTTWTTRYTSGSNQSTYSYTIPANVDAIRVRLYAAGGTTLLLDEEIAPVVEDGPSGQDGAPGPAGTPGLMALLTNDAHTIPTASDGSGGNYTGASTTAIVYHGTEDVSGDWNCSAAPGPGVTGSLSGKTYTVTNMTGDTGYVDLTLTRTGYATLVVRFSLSKARRGANARVYAVKTSVAAIKRTRDGVFIPAQLGVSATSTTGDSAPVPYTGRYVIAFSLDGENFSNGYTSPGDELSASYAPPASAVAVRVRLYAAGSFSTLLDEEVVPVVEDGPEGPQGPPGEDAHVPTPVSFGHVGRMPPTTVAPDLVNVVATIRDEDNRPGTLTAWVNHGSHDDANPAGPADGSINLQPSDGLATVTDAHLWDLTGGGTGRLFRNVHISAAQGKSITLQYTAADGQTTGQQTFVLRSWSQIVDDELGEILPDALKYSWQIAKGMRPPAVLPSLPTGNPDDLNWVYVDGLLYKWAGGAWQPLVNAEDLDGEIGEDQIADAAVTAEKIRDASVGLTKFASGMRPVEVVAALPTSGNVVGRTVVLTTDGKLYRYTSSGWSTAVPTSDLTGEVGEDLIADAAVTAEKIRSGAVGLAAFASGLRPVEVVSSLPASGNTVGRTVFLTTTGKLHRYTSTGWTSAVPVADLAGQIGTGQIADAAITAQKIGDQAVSTAKIATGAVTQQLIASGAVIAEKLANNAVTQQKIAEGAVTTQAIADAAVAAGKLASSAVYPRHMVAGSAGMALNDDPTMIDLGAWLLNGDWEVRPVSNGPAGTSALRISEATNTNSRSIFTAKAFPVDRGRTYRVSVWANQTAGDGRNYFAVSFLDANGDPISYGAGGASGWPGGGVHHYWGVVNQVLPAGWNRYEFTFGAKGQGTIPAAARSMRIGGQVVRGNTSTSTLWLQDFRVEEVINTTLIADDAITTPKLVALSVTAAKVAAGAIETEKLAADAVTAGKIAAGAVEAAKIAAGAVTTAKLDAFAVTTEKLAAGAVEAGNIAAGAVTTAKLDALAVTTEKLAAGAVQTQHITAGAVTTEKIEAGAVTAAHIAAGAVTTGKLDVLAVTADKLAANAVTAGKLAANAVTAGTIAADAITAGTIASGAVGAEEIAAGAVQAEHIRVGSRMLPLANPSVTGVSDGWPLGVVGVTNRFGSTVTALESETDGNLLRYSEWIDIDPTKTYEVRASLRSIQGHSGTTDGGILYFGLQAENAAGTLIAVTPFDPAARAFGTATDNPYFWSGGLGSGAWRDMVAYIIGANADAAEVRAGKNVTSHFRLPPTAQRVRLRWLNWSNGGVTRRAYLWSPTLTPIDATLIHGDGIVANSITTNKLAFEVVGSTNVVASINASTEGLRIQSDKITIDGSVQFGTGYDPTTKETPAGAQAKANAAQTAAINAAATDAESKASAAQAAAEATAALLAEQEAEAARLAAIDAASGDASTKAAAAQAAAEATAALLAEQESEAARLAAIAASLDKATYLTAGTTTIEGGTITTGSIAADQLAANSVVTGKIAAGAVKADEIDARAVGTEHLRIGSPALPLNNPSVTGSADGWPLGVVGVTNRHGTTVQALHIETNGNTQRVSDWLEVDPTRTYEVRASLRSIEGHSGETDGGILYFGVQAEDANGNTLSVTRYDVATRQYTSSTTNGYFWSGGLGSAGWRDMVGYVLGENTPEEEVRQGKRVTNHIRLPANARRIRLMWLNWSNGGTSRIAYLWSPTITPVDATLIHGDGLVTGSVTTQKLAFTAVETGEVIAAINASSEGLRIQGERIRIDGQVQFANRYDPTAILTPGQTTIDGGKITTGSIAADQLAANSVIAGKLAAGAINTSALFATGVVTADAIAANAVVADKISVTTLSEIIDPNGAPLGIVVSGLLRNAGDTIRLNLDATGAQDILRAPNVAIRANGTISLGDHFSVDASGNVTYAGALSGASGTFSGELTAASGTFAGTVTAEAVIASGDLSAENVDLSAGGELILRPEGLYGLGGLSWRSEAGAILARMSTDSIFGPSLTISAQAGRHMQLAAGNSARLRLNHTVGAGGTGVELFHSGSWKEIQIGAVDSGGSGRRALTIAN